MDYLDYLKRNNQQRKKEYAVTAEYLFKELFTSPYFSSLGDHDIDKLYDLVKSVHEGEFVLPKPVWESTRIKTRQGWDTLCYFLSEVGFPTASWTY
jgi:hypothetical protein